MKQPEAFNLFTHLKIPKDKRVENFANLKQAVTELFLSVKIRSDEEIDVYGAEQYEQEKLLMRDVDCFTIVDYIKGSVEILMNMKMGDGGKEEEDEEEEIIDQSFIEKDIVLAQGKTPPQEMQNRQRNKRKD